MRITQQAPRLPFSGQPQKQFRPNLAVLSQRSNEPEIDRLTLSRPNFSNSVKFAGGNGGNQAPKHENWLKKALIFGLLGTAGKPAASQPMILQWDDGDNYAVANTSNIIRTHHGETFQPSSAIQYSNEQYYTDRFEQKRLSDQLEAMHAQQVDKFVQKAGTDDQKEVHKLLAQGMDINEADQKGMTALGQAINKGRHTMVDFLIDQGVDVNKPYGPDQNPPLLDAVSLKNPQIIQSLIDAKVDVNQGNKNGLTPLMKAASYGDVKILKKLIDAKADVNQGNKIGFTPVMFATMSGKKEAVETLIQAKADVNQAAEGGITPLILAVYGNHVSGHSIEILKTLIRAKANVNQGDERGRTPLIYAAAYGNMKIAQELVGAKANVNQADKYGRTPIMYAQNPKLLSHHDDD